jgi:hypothetical protein
LPDLRRDIIALLGSGEEARKPNQAKGSYAEQAAQSYIHKSEPPATAGQTATQEMSALL